MRRLQLALAGMAGFIALLTVAAAVLASYLPWLIVIAFLAFIGGVVFRG